MSGIEKYVYILFNIEHKMNKFFIFKVEIKTRKEYTIN